MLALGRLVDLLIADPAPAVARDLVSILEHRVDCIRMALERHRRTEDRDRNALLAEEPQQPPQSGA